MEQFILKEDSESFQISPWKTKKKVPTFFTWKWVAQDPFFLPALEGHGEEGCEGSAFGKFPRSIFLNWIFVQTRKPPRTTCIPTATARKDSPTFSPRLRPLDCSWLRLLAWGGRGEGMPMSGRWSPGGIRGANVGDGDGDGDGGDNGEEAKGSTARTSLKKSKGGMNKAKVRDCSSMGERRGGTDGSQGLRPERMAPPPSAGCKTA